MSLGHDPGYRFALFSNHPLDGPLTDIAQVVLIQHGLARNGVGYYRTGLELMRELRVDAAHTLLLAPQFFVTKDEGRAGLEGVPLWTSGGWLAGRAAARGETKPSSLAVYDDLLAWLADRGRLPALKRIVLAGHSAGGQLLQRYAVLNGTDARLRKAGIEVRYVIANPSSYLYFTDERPRPGGGFAPYDRASCPTYDDYKYGFERMIPYGAALDPMQAYARYASREVVYLLGDRDVDPNHRALDKTCGGEAQGAYRLERGMNYLRYERRLADDRIALAHRAYVVHGVAHSQRRMFTSACAARELFGQSYAGGVACDEVQLSGKHRDGR
jgi:hypothetical protein